MFFYVQESGDDEDDDLADFIVEDDENEDFEFHDPLEEMFRRDFDEHFNNNGAAMDDAIFDNDDSDSDSDFDDDDDDDDDSDSDFDDNVRFFLATTSESSD